VSPAKLLCKFNDEDKNMCSRSSKKRIPTCSRVPQENQDQGWKEKNKKRKEKRKEKNQKNKKARKKRQVCNKANRAANKVCNKGKNAIRKCNRHKKPDKFLREAKQYLRKLKQWNRTDRKGKNRKFESYRRNLHRGRADGCGPHQ